MDQNLQNKGNYSGITYTKLPPYFAHFVHIKFLQKQKVSDWRFVCGQI